MFRLTPVLGLLVLTACGTGATAPATDAVLAVTSQPSGAGASPSPSPSPMIAPEGQAAVQAALSEAAKRLNVATTAVSVEIAERRDWPDSSLGCPQPGQMYAQVITPGYLVSVSGAGKKLEYHTDARGSRAVLCKES